MRHPHYKIVEHPADIGYEVYAPDRPSLFADAVVAYYDMVIGSDRIRPQVEQIMEVEGSDDEDLLVALLSRCLLVTETEQRIFCQADVESLRGYRIRLRLQGEPLDAARHAFEYGVKAVTYHQLSVGATPDGSWRAHVIFDI